MVPYSTTHTQHRLNVVVLAYAFKSHIWPARQRHRRLRSVVWTSRRVVLSVGRIRQCVTSFGSHRRNTGCGGKGIRHKKWGRLEVCCRFFRMECPGVAPSQMVGVSASVIVPCTVKVQKNTFFWHQLTRIVPEKWP